MKVTINKQTQEVIEFDIPCYVKFGEHYTKVLSETSILIVTDWEHSNKSITIDNILFSSTFSNEGWKFITEEEFNAVHLKVAELLSQYLPVETI